MRTSQLGTAIALPPITIIGAGTHVLSFPDNCVGWEAWLWGSGATGGSAVAGSQRHATGGTGASYVHLYRARAASASSLTVVTGAQVTAAGANGNQSTITDGFVTATAPGGVAGTIGHNASSTAGPSAPAAGFVSDGGPYEGYAGGTSGSITTGSTNCKAATGGGSAAGPWGNGKSSGTINHASNNALTATGGASPFFASGGLTSSGATGGAGQGGSGPNNSRCPGGAGGPGTTVRGGPGLSGDVSGSHMAVESEFIFLRRGSAAGAISPGDAGTGAGSWGEINVSTNRTTGRGGWMGGSGSLYSDSGSITVATGDAGAFAGSGAIVTGAGGTGTTKITGDAGIAAGSGAIAEETGSPVTVGYGGVSLAVVVFYVR